MSKNWNREKSVEGSVRKTEVHSQTGIFSKTKYWAGDPKTNKGIITTDREYAIKKAREQADK